MITREFAGDLDYRFEREGHLHHDVLIGLTNQQMT